MRTTVAVVAAVAVVTVSGIAVGGAIASPATGDDAVEPVLVGALQVESSPAASPTASEAASTAPATPRTVEGLDELSGTLAYQSDDVDEFEVGGVELELGPEEWLAAATAPADYDADGSIGTVLEELQALVGRPVTVAGRLDDKGEELEVFRIQGLAFREVSGGPAPWERDGAVASRERIEEAALEAVGPGARVLSVEAEDDDGAAWEVEVLSADGREYRVLLDAAGVVLDTRAEDTPTRTTTTAPAATRTTEAGDDKGGQRPEGAGDDGPGDDKGGQRADDDDDDDDDSGKGRGRGGDDRDDDDRDDD